MSTSFIVRTGVAATAAMLLGASALPASAKDNAPVYNVSPGLAKRIQAAAQRGPEHLRVFVQRTRMIYALDYEDAVKIAQQTRIEARPAIGQITAPSGRS